MKFGQPEHERQTDTAADMFAVYLVEPLENLALLVQRYPHTRIADLEYQIAVLFEETDSDSAFFRIFECIGYQVIHYEIQILFVQDEGLVLQIRDEVVFYPLVLRQLFIKREILEHQIECVFSGDPEFEHTLLGPAVVHQLVHQMQYPVCIPFDEFQLFPHPFVRSLGYHLLKRGYYQSQRRPELMRDIDEKAHFHLCDLILGFLPFLFHFELGFHGFPLPQEAGDEIHESGHEQYEKTFRPPCGIPYRPDRYAKCGRSIVPDTVTVGRLDHEGIVPRRKVRI